MKKFLLDYLQFQLSRLIAGQKNYDVWKIKNYSLKTASIKNKQLAKELEAMCKKREGFLLYSEYLECEQFGKNGYHAHHLSHGATQVHYNWAKALVTLCRNNGLTHVVELGPGDGSLGVELIKTARKNGVDIRWSGIEINPRLREYLHKRFEKEGIESFIKHLVPSIEKISITEDCLVVFPYSLDSIPPDIFINTQSNKSFPNAVIGIQVKDGVLQEFIVTDEYLRKKSRSLQNGIFTDISSHMFDMKSWKLFKGQRAFIPINAFSLFIDYANTFSPESLFVIIDEFRASPMQWETGHLCVPRDLYTFTRDLKDMEKGYGEAGENLWYYPTYFATFLKFLHSVGFSSLQYDIEQKLAKELTGEKWYSLKRFYTTYAFLASEKRETQSKSFRIEFPQIKLI